MKIREHIKKLELNIEHKDILNYPQFKAELLEGGLKTVVPCLPIKFKEPKSLWLYESDDIIDFLNIFKGDMIMP